MSTKHKRIGKVIFIVLLIILVLVILGLIFIQEIPHQAILEYAKILISWPTAIILVAILIFYYLRFILYKEERAIVIHEKDPDVTGFINIVEK